jgi:hypothetical protein
MPILRLNENNEPGRTRMRWVVAFFLALVLIPFAQVAADAWHGRAGPHVLMLRAHSASADLAKTRHHRLYDPFAPWFPTKAKTG